MKFNRTMLPISGTQWHLFPTEARAKAFAAWAERVTRLDRRPCQAWVVEVHFGPGQPYWEVQVSNW
jgi:hypothetical protein